MIDLGRMIDRQERDAGAVREERAWHQPAAPDADDEVGPPRIRLDLGGHCLDIGEKQFLGDVGECDFGHAGDPLMENPSVSLGRERRNGSCASVPLAAMYQRARHIGGVDGAVIAEYLKREQAIR